MGRRRAAPAAAGRPRPGGGVSGINLLPIAAGQTRGEGSGGSFPRDRRPPSAPCARATGKLLLDGGGVFLYNLRSDIGERNDLAKERPEIARRLRPLILEWEKDVDSEAKTSGNFIAPGPPAGQAAAARRQRRPRRSRTSY